MNSRACRGRDKNGKLGSHLFPAHRGSSNAWGDSRSGRGRRATTRTGPPAASGRPPSLLPSFQPAAGARSVRRSGARPGRDTPPHPSAPGRGLPPSSPAVPSTAPSPAAAPPPGPPQVPAGSGAGGGSGSRHASSGRGTRTVRFASPRLGAAAPPPQVRAAAPRSGGWGSSRGGARRRGAAFPVESNGEGGTTTGGGAAGRLPSPPTPRLPSGSRCEAGTAPHLSVPGGGPKTLAALLGTERRGCPRAPRDGGGQGGRPGAGGRRCPGPEEPPRGGPRLPCRWVPGRQRLAGWVLSAPEVRRERQTLRSDGEEDGTVVTSLTHLSAVRGDRMLLYL